VRTTRSSDANSSASSHICVRLREPSAATRPQPTISRRTPCLRSWRQSQLDQEAAERTLVAADDPEAPVALDELRLALRSLPDEQREALVLVGAGGFAYEEAAEICGCAVGTVKSRVSRARRALQAALEAGSYERDGAPAGEAMGSILADAERLSGAR
jgi:RNA polymerase sigma-70 factor (ECF subfamily)